MHLNDEDLLEIGIYEKGPRKLILTYIEQNQGESSMIENIPANFQNTNNSEEVS